MKRVSILLILGIALINFSACKKSSPNIINVTYKGTIKGTLENNTPFVNNVEFNFLENNIVDVTYQDLAPITVKGTWSYDTKGSKNINQKWRFFWDYNDRVTITSDGKTISGA
jgi:hypothetical protein